MNCPLCQDDRSERLCDQVAGAPDGRIYRCGNCGLVYLYPTMTESEEGKFYENDFPGYMEERAGGSHWKDPEAHFQKFLRDEGYRRLKLLQTRLEPHHEVLEVGSATGYLLELLKPAVAEVMGVEPGPAQRAYAKERGLEVHPALGDVEPRQFDAVLCYYVLEHMSRPVPFLRQLADFIKPGGRLILEVPNVEDVLLSRYDIKNFPGFYYQKMHVTYFDRQTLARALEEAGYTCEIFPEQRYDLSNHLVWMRDGKPGGMGRFAEFIEPQVQAVYAEALKSHWLCDTLMAVAQPRG